MMEADRMHYISRFPDMEPTIFREWRSIFKWNALPWRQKSSKWDGDLNRVVEEKTPVYLVVGEDDEYYSSEPAEKAYKELTALYERAGISGEEVDRLAVLDIKEKSYFSDRGVSNQHGGGGLLAEDEEIMGWLFGAHL